MTNLTTKAQILWCVLPTLLIVSSVFCWMTIRDINIVWEPSLDTITSVRKQGTYQWCAIPAKVDSDSIPIPDQWCSIQFRFQFHPRKYWFNSIPIPIPPLMIFVQFNSDSNSFLEFWLQFNSNSAIPEKPWNPIPIPILELELQIIGTYTKFYSVLCNPH